MDEEVTSAPVGKADYDREEMARLTRMALRGRTIRSGAKEMGLGESTVSKLTRGKLESCPSVNVLRKLNAGNPPELLRRMLVACKCSSSVREELDAYAQMVKNAPISEDMRSNKAVWSVSSTLAMMLDNLAVKGYGSDYAIDYCTEGMFAIDMGEGEPLLVCIPLVLSESDPTPSKAVKLTLEKLKQAIKRWGVKDVGFIILTDSPSVYQLLKQIPNRSKVMAVAVASDDGRSIVRQYTILPIESSMDKPGKFPVDLSIFGDELMVDI